jgi:hypothetical protein
MTIHVESMGVRARDSFGNGGEPVVELVRFEDDARWEELEQKGVEAPDYEANDVLLLWNPDGVIRLEGERYALKNLATRMMEALL